MRIVFFGTPEFAAHHLKHLVERGENIVAVVTREDKPKGRSLKLAKPPVKELAEEILPETPLFQPKKASTAEFVRDMQELQPDLFIVVAYGEIISQDLLDVPKVACVNVHGSLLPKYRGAAPIQRAIMEGERESGVTIMHMAKKMDAGDVINQVVVPISEEMTSGELYEELMVAGCKGLDLALKEFKEGRVPRISQDHELATYAKKITPEDGRINFNCSADEHYNTFKGVTPFPGAWCQVKIRGKERRLKIEKCSRVSAVEGSPKEILLYGNEGVVVKCSAEALCLQQIKLEGKKSMSAEEFARGVQRDEIEFL